MTLTGEGEILATGWPPDFRNHTRYRLTNLRVPPALCDVSPSSNGWCEIDLGIDQGKIVSVEPAGQGGAIDAPTIDALESILLSGLVDCHTHLDKAHVSSFAEFSSSDLVGAIGAMAENKKTWTADQLQRRVEFSLKSSFAYGTRALRSHVDFAPESPQFIWEVMNAAVDGWRDRIDVQLVPLANILHFDDPGFCHSIYATARQHGRIGMFLYDQPNLKSRLLPIFERAKTEGWDIDLHVDEGLDAKLDGLNTVAQVVLETTFTGTVLCGHCVALNSYNDKRRSKIIRRAVDAGLHFVALPSTNLYLQSRDQNHMPQFRGMAPVANLAAAGATVSMGADNVGDAFCAFGDFDPMAVLNLGAQLGHLDEPARDWAELVTCNPATSIGLEWNGKICSGAPADLVLFAGRTSGEISQRNAPRRAIIRKGKCLSLDPPDFRELN